MCWDFDFDWSLDWGNAKVAIFDESFKDYKPTSCERWFYNCQQLTEIRNLDYLNTENVTNMNDMFLGCQMLTELDLSNFNTTHVTNMNYMFINCTNLATVYVGDDWITDNVTSYDYIFYGCDNLYGGKGTSCTESDIKYARIDGGESSPGYFTRKGDTKPEVVSIKVSKLPQQTEYSLGESFFYNIAKDTEGMIELSLSNGATRSIAFTSVLKSITGSISKLDSTKTGVQTLTVSFLGKETTFDVTVVDRGVCGYQFLDEDGTLTFYYGNYQNGAWYIGEVGFSKPFEAKVKKAVFDKSFANYYPTSLKNWFSRYENLTEIEGLEYLNTENVTNMGSMFEYCSSLTTLDVSNFNTANVRNMMTMFIGCSRLTTLDLSSFNTENLEDMTNMFTGCRSLTTLDLSSFNTENVTYMGNLFCDCSNIKNIYVGDNWITAPETEYCGSDNMFYNCTNLVGGKGTTYDANLYDLTYARIDDPDNGKPGYFTYKGVEPMPIDTVFTAPTKLSYLEGDELDLTGGKITIVYSDETTEDIDLTNADVTLSAFDNTAIGEQVITVKYKGVEIGTFTVTVAKPEPQPENPYTEPEVKDNVYQISTAEDLLYFMFDVNSGHVDANAILTQDIVINADLFKQITDLLKRTSKAAPDLIEWQPIGTEENAYRGTFDGNGHTISGIYIKDENQSNAGLFGNVASEAVIKNLGVTDSYIAGNENVGAICGKSEGTIVNCYTVSEVKGNKNVNPLVGAKETAAIVENCFYFAEAPVADDPCAKTAEQFKSGEVAAQLAKGATINGETFSGETFSGVTELPGTEVIEDLHDPENPPTPVSQVSSISNVKVWSYNRTIYIENAPDAEYRIIDLNGRVITTSKTQSTKEEIKINKSGVLIVIIGNQSFKITL